MNNIKRKKSLIGFIFLFFLPFNLLLTAKNAGVPCISVLWGFRNRDEIKAAGGNYFCEDAHDLPALVEKIAVEMFGK